LFGWELEHFLEYGVADPSSRTVAACRPELERLAARLSALPRVFCHRDFHAWNIHVSAGQIRIIDFQDALLAPRLYDVASLLTDRRTPDLITPEREARLLEAYRTASDDAGLAPFDPADLVDEYRLCVLQRALKVVGRFNYLADVKGKDRYARLLPWTVATARRAASALPDLDATNRVLESELKDRDR
jgi:aminoglycoside/choline kinase family phosphotransferase